MHPTRPPTEWRPLLGRSARGASRGAIAPLRMRLLMMGYAALVAVVFARVITLEVTHGAAYRELASRPLLRVRSLPGPRGRILARDGTVLAQDMPVVALAVHYRYLEQPANDRWLRSTARRQLAPAESKDASKLSSAERRVLAERAELHRRLRRMCGLSADQWNQRNERIQRQVERIAASVNSRQEPPSGEAGDVAVGEGVGWLPRLKRTIVDALRSGEQTSPARITVAEELDYHIVADHVPLDVAAEIEANPRIYPGVRVVHTIDRAYPRGSLAAHTLGHLGPVTPDDLAGDKAATGESPVHPDDRIGRAGIERQYDLQLRGRRGEVAEWTDRSGRLLRTEQRRPAAAGRDLVLTIDAALQQTAESLLDDALSRRPPAAENESRPPGGGAVAVIDVRNGALLAAASAPRFDPNAFSTDDDRRRAEVLNDPAGPLLDRVTQMQIPPGSVFKTVSAVALLESRLIAHGDAIEEPFYCRGYLHDPDRHRCLVFRRYGQGHGQVTLDDALAKSCNVYFFHYAQQMGPAPLVWWARQTGFGRRTGVDLPGETHGNLPSADLLTIDSTGAVDPLALAIGQGTLTVTPLQVARLMAAVANGGQLVTPRVVSRLGLVETSDPALDDDDSGLPHTRPPRPIPDLSPETLRAVRHGLKRVVSHPDGTAHATVHLEDIAVAGKTGTAETGGGRADHAWFAGYVPADAPRWAFVVVLEHAGSGSAVAGPIARRLVQKMQALGYLVPTNRAKNASRSE